MAKLPGSLVPEATARFLKTMFEDWKNLNILMVKMVFEVLEMLLTNGNVTLPVIIFKSYSGLMYSKLSDRNFKETMIGLFRHFSRKTSPLVIVTEII